MIVMKILLLCAGGMSSSIVMKRLRSYASEQDLDCEIKATGISSYRDIISQYDCVLLAPQTRYYYRRLKQESSVPVGIIEPSDYGLGDVSHVFEQVSELFEHEGLAGGDEAADRNKVDDVNEDAGVNESTDGNKAADARGPKRPGASGR